MTERKAYLVKLGAGTGETRLSRLIQVLASDPDAALAAARARQQKAPLYRWSVESVEITDWEVLEVGQDEPVAGGTWPPLPITHLKGMTEEGESSEDASSAPE